ncbi:MAG: helix-turn-helix domain-containing protein [Spirochaetaceae bacterium]|nr:MAG: helix-turn-helix domain-containing protein [Spirochaetaceae bacterium]
MNEVAAVAHYSPYHFHRLFEHFCGETLMAYVRRLRLEQAAYEFRLGSESIGRTASSLGFTTHEAFTRRFHSAFGVAPRTYRASSSTPFRGASVRIQSLEVVRFPGACCVSTRIRGGYQHLVPPAHLDSPWHRLARAAGVVLSDKDVSCFGVCWDDPLITDEPVIRYDACLSVSGRTFDPYRFETVTIGAGKYARARWCGPIESMTEDYHYLIYEWPGAHRSRVDPSRPPFEHFIANREPSPSDDSVMGCRAVEADIFIPLR